LAQGRHQAKAPGCFRLPAAAMAATAAAQQAAAAAAATAVAP